MSWRQFDRTMLVLGRKFDRELNRLVQPRKEPLFKGPSFFELAMKELTTLPKKKRK